MGSSASSDVEGGDRGLAESTYKISRSEEAELVQAYISDKIKAEDVMDYYERMPNGELGSGSFGRVWKAQNYDTGEIRAIKTIRNPRVRELGREIKASIIAPTHPVHAP